MIHLVTFSDESMSRARELCVASALGHGCDTANGWDLRYLRHFPSFREDWTMNRGLGWWHWKPIVIQQALHEHLTNDMVIWADAGIEFIAPVQHIIDRMDQDVWLFGNNWEHAHWCKADVIHELWPYPVDLPPPGFANFVPPMKPDDWKRGWDLFGKQVQASVIVIRVSDYSRAFVAEWLKWCLYDGGRLIDDSPSRAPNHPEFREHRHDQSILTTLSYREGIKLHYWPAMYNDGAFTYEKLPEYAGDDYPILVHHHRRRDHEWP